MITSKRYADQWQIVLKPNRSATWAQSKLFIGIMAIPIAIIGVGWSIVGGWVILPFAGLEIGLLAFLMLKVSHQTYQEQIIIISKESISVQTGFRKKFKQTVARNGCHVLYSETENDWQLPVISVISDKVEITLGQFLNLTDRQLLKLELQRAGLVICRPQWWRD